MDVNVHPTKMELRFSKNEFVYRFVLETVKECLANRELTARVKLPDPVKQQQFTKSPENIKQTEKSYVQENLIRHHVLSLQERVFTIQQNLLLNKKL